MRLKIFRLLVVLEIIAYALVMLYVLSGPISVMMWVYVVGGGLVFFAVPSLVLGIWGFVECKRVGDSSLRRNIKFLTVTALIPLLITTVGWIISVFLAIKYPPHVN